MLFRSAKGRPPCYPLVQKGKDIPFAGRTVKADRLCFCPPPRKGNQPRSVRRAKKLRRPREKRKHSACKRIKLPSTNVSYTNYIIIRQKTQLIVKKFFSSLIFHLSGHFKKKWKKFLKTCVHLSYLMCYNCLKYEQTFVFCKKVGTAGWTNAKNVG